MQKFVLIVMLTNRTRLGHLGTHAYPQGTEFPLTGLLVLNCLTHSQVILLEHFAQGGKVVKNITQEVEEEQIITSFQLGKDLMALGGSGFI